MTRSPEHGRPIRGIIVALLVLTGMLAADVGASCEEDRCYVCLYGHAVRVQTVACPAPFRANPSGYMTWMTYHCPGTGDMIDPPSWDVVLPDERVAVYARLHVLQSLGHALDAPQGLLAGEIFVEYADGSETTCELIVGVNTAEWAYDRPDWAHCLLHEPVAPARSWESIDSEGNAFLGHSFYVVLDLDLDRRVRKIGFRLSDAACAPRSCCGGDELYTWFSVSIEALALELPDAGD